MAFKISEAGLAGCTIDGCLSPYRAKGYCNAHYQMWRKYGDPLAGGTSKGDPLEWIKIYVTHCGDECLTWPFARSSTGYGNIQYNGRFVRAHRVMCEMANGPAPSPLHEVCHYCGNGDMGCVNPKHLHWGTRKENMEECVAHGKSPRGARHGSVKLTEDDVRAIRRRYANGGISFSELGRQYGVSSGHARLIILRERWSWLTDVDIAA